MKKTLYAFLLLALASAAAAGPFEQLRTGLELPAAPEPAPGSKASLDHLQGDDRYWITVAAADKYDRTALLNAELDIIETGKNAVYLLGVTDDPYKLVL